VTVTDPGTSRLSTAPDPVAALGRGRDGNGVLPAVAGWWRRLTSMRTALVLLFLLAVAAVPGSVLPQRGLNQLKVDDYVAAHPTLAPVLDRIGAFDTFAAPWFAAIYLLLFVSLVGCLVPRMRLHVRALIRRPPPAPRHLDRLPLHHRATGVTGDPAAVAARARSALRRRGWRTTTRIGDDGSVALSAEKGYLRETGNLVFHFALVALLLGLGSGALFGWRGTALVVEGDTVCDTVQGYDQWSPGRLVDGSNLPPFCLTLDDFNATYLPTGQPVGFAATVRHDDGSGRAEQPATIGVNNPLRLRGATAYLLNHGYAPEFRYTDKYGTHFSGASPALPQDASLTSEGIAVYAEANQDPKPGSVRTENVQVAFDYILTPTTPTTGPTVRSLSPEARSPAVTMIAYRGNTGLDSGIPKSVYALDARQIESGALVPIGTKLLREGETWTLDDGSTLTYVGTKEWATFQLSDDPGKPLVLAAAIAIVAGLLASLTVRRRRLWVVATADGDGPTVVRAGALARHDSSAMGAEFQKLVTAIAVPDRPAGRPAGKD
jgi:cytochrome c biogenesis protein